MWARDPSLSRQVPAPRLINGSHVSDGLGILTPSALSYVSPPPSPVAHSQPPSSASHPSHHAQVNRNLSLIDRVTPFRVLLLIARRLPRDPWARKQYGVNLLRHWLTVTRNYDRATLLMLGADGVADVVSGPKCRLIMTEAIARHFAIRAAELLNQPRRGEHPPPRNSSGDSLDGGYRVPPSRIEECALKLSFYVAFMYRQRTAMSMISMRLLSMGAPLVLWRHVDVLSCCGAT